MIAAPSRAQARVEKGQEPLENSVEHVGCPAPSGARPAAALAARTAPRHFFLFFFFLARASARRGHHIGVAFADHTAVFTHPTRRGSVAPPELAAVCTSADGSEPVAVDLLPSWPHESVGAPHRGLAAAPPVAFSLGDPLVRRQRLHGTCRESRKPHACGDWGSTQPRNLGSIAATKRARLGDPARRSGRGRRSWCCPLASREGRRPWRRRWRSRCRGRG